MSGGLHRFFDQASNTARLAVMNEAADLKRQGRALMARAEKMTGDGKLPLMAEAVSMMERAASLKHASTNVAVATPKKRPLEPVSVLSSFKIPKKTPASPLVQCVSPSPRHVSPSPSPRHVSPSTRHVSTSPRHVSTSPRTVSTSSIRSVASPKTKHASPKPDASTKRDGYSVGVDVVYEREKYLARTPAEIRAMLDRYGVAVVPDVLTRGEAAASFDEMIQCLELMYEGSFLVMFFVDLVQMTPLMRTGFVFKDPSTWALLRRVSYCKHGMLYQHMGVGWAQFAVNLRQNPKVAAVFAELWSVVTGKPVANEDLFSSADGIAFGATRPGDRGGFHGKDWMHLDQEANDTVPSFQGGLNLVETKKGDGSFQFLEASHLQFDDFFRRLSNQKKKDGKPIDFKRFTLLENQKQFDYFLKQGCMPKCLALLPGDLFLWSSKLVHSGRPPLRPTVPVPPSKVFLRGVVYVSMQPKHFATPSDLKKKTKVWLDAF